MVALRWLWCRHGRPVSNRHWQSGWRSGKYLHTHWFDLSQCRDRIHWCVRVKHYRSQWRSRPVARLLPGLLCGSISQLREREERNQEYSCLFCCCNPIARGVLFILLPFFHHACFWLMNKSSKKCLIVMTHSITTKTRDCHSDGRHELGLIWWSLYASITPRFHGILGEGYHMDHLSFVLAQDKGALKDFSYTGVQLTVILARWDDSNGGLVVIIGRVGAEWQPPLQT